jgi:hypothetical protein
MAHGFEDVGDDLRFIRSRLRFLGQTFQEFGHRPFHLAHRSPPTVFIFGFETTI